MKSERGFDRLVNFSDAVVAIAITLLVLPLVTEASELKNETILEFLQRNGMQFFSFFLSFAIIGRFWLVHHKFFDRLVAYNRSMMVWNLLWLLGIVFLPFPTELFATEHNQSLISGSLYIITMLWIAASFLGITVIAKRHTELMQSGKAEDARVFVSVVMCALLLVALLVTIFVPAIGMWSLMILFLMPIFELLYRPKHTEKAHTQQS